MTDALVYFLKAWEGFKAEASGDPLVPGVRDIGHGHVIKPGEHFGTLTPADADALLRADLADLAERVDELIAATLQEHQRDALLSFTYNLGAGALAHSTLLRLVNACRFDAAACQFTLWCHANGHVVSGLEKRRIAEQVIFCRADYSGRP